MRKIAIQLDEKPLHPGETIEGKVLIKCDSDFQCERIRITLRGIELARVVIHAGKVTIVHEEKRVHIEKSKNLSECIMVPHGESQYDFSFSLPTNIPGSYVGTHGSIKYTLQAIAEISWARDLKFETDLYIPFTADSATDSLSNLKSGIFEIDGITLIKAQTDSNHITLGESFSFQFSVDRTAKIRGVRAEIVRQEHVEPKGHKMDTKRTIAEEYYPDRELTRDLWTEAKIHTNARWTPSFSTELITCQYLLKITLDIPLRPDSVIEIPIMLNIPRTDNDAVFDF